MCVICMQFVLESRETCFQRACLAILSFGGKEEMESEDTEGSLLASAIISSPAYTSLGVTCIDFGSCQTAYSYTGANMFQLLRIPPALKYIKWNIQELVDFSSVSCDTFHDKNEAYLHMYIYFPAYKYKYKHILKILYLVITLCKRNITLA